MKAVILTDEGAIELTERPLPVAGPNDLLVRVGACGICGTDLHAPQMRAMFASNVVLGHEFAGTVVETGAGAQGFAAGDAVVINPIALACGACDACRRGLSNQCLVSHGQTSGLARDGGIAEYVAVHQRQAHRVPETLSVRDAAWTEPLAVAVRAAALAHLEPGTSVAILGAGPIGQLILQLAKNAGAGHTLVVESSLFRRQTAQACGADAVASPDDTVDIGRLFDVVFDCTGAPAAFQTALALVGHRGRVVVLGSYTTPITFEATPAAVKEPSVLFSIVYRDDLEFATALRLLESGLVNVQPLTTDFLAIERHKEAFDMLRDPERAVKVFLDPGLV